MKKSIFVISAFVLMIVASLAFTKKEDPIFKNLKVLPKDITEHQLDSVMHHFTASLNVKCGFCHVRNEETKKMDFPSDENKHKLVARNMLKMTAKINDKFFDVSGAKKNMNAQLMVTCYTCHHGSTDPLTKPPKEEKGSK